MNLTIDKKMIEDYVDGLRGVFGLTNWQIDVSWHSGDKFGCQMMTDFPAKKATIRIPTQALENQPQIFAVVTARISEILMSGLVQIAQTAKSRTNLEQELMVECARVSAVVGKIVAGAMMVDVKSDE